MAKLISIKERIFREFDCNFIHPMKSAKHLDETSEVLDYTIRETKKVQLEKIIEIIDNFCFGDTEENIEVKRSLKEEFAILGADE